MFGYHIEVENKTFLHPQQVTKKLLKEYPELSCDFDSIKEAKTDARNKLYKLRKVWYLMLQNCSSTHKEQVLETINFINDSLDFIEKEQ